MIKKAIHILLPFALIFTAFSFESYAQGTCVDFEDMEDGTVLSSGGQLPVSYDVNLSVMPFTNTGGQVADGTITVQHDMHEGLDGLMLRAENALASFRVSSSVNALTIGIKELGGEIEVRVDESKMTYPSIAFLDGSRVGAATVRLVYGTQGQPVAVMVEGRFSECAIGGSQVWLDNLCTSANTIASAE